MKIADFCSELDLQLGLSSPDERLPICIKMLAKAYSVAQDEIAIFFLDPDREELSFLWPEKLKTSGTIPLNAKNSLVARTARETRGYLDNHFAKTSHSVIFEAFAVERKPIQKIMSVPLLESNKTKGVVQISRKGAETAEAGKDFTQSELTALQKMAEIIGRHI